MTRSRLTIPIRALAAIAVIAYPILVWRGLSTESPRSIALILLVILAPAAYLRLRNGKNEKLRGVAIIPVITVTILGLATALNSLGLILLVPVAINTAFLVTFGSTLRAGSTPMVERIALLQEDELNSDQVDWCRLWTRIWCTFFVINGSIAAALGLFAPLAWWAFYNGLLSYICSGILFATEWIIRRRKFGHLDSTVSKEAQG